jgi:hypothetical protein
MAGDIRDANSLTTIRARMANQITTIDSTVDTQQGTPVKDIVVDAPSVEIRGNYVIEDYVNRIKNLDEFISILDDDAYLEDMRTALGFSDTADVVDLVEGDLEDFADTFGITRISAVKALYVQRFYRTDNNSGATVTVPLGTEVKTPDGTISAVTITSIAQIPVLDTARGLYYVEETAEASESGSGGNVALNSLTTMTPQLSQATSTGNVSLITAGVDQESNESLVARVKNARKGRNYPTEVGLEQLATGALDGSTLSFTDANAIGPNSALMTRALAGAVDLYVVGKSLAAYSESFTFLSSQSTYVLGTQPVESASSVTSGTTASAIPFTFNSDVSGGFAGSTRAQGSVTLTSPGSLTHGDILTVSYNYDSAIQEAQALVDTGGTFHAPAMDLLFRQSRQVSISIDLEVVQYGTRSQTDVQTDVSNDLAAFFNGGTTSNGVVYGPKAIGEDIDRSDVVTVVAAVDDVDRVTLVGTKAIVFYKDGVVTTEAPISIADNQHARIGTVTYL